MATALDFITRALRIAGVTAEGETPSAAQGQDALATLNGMLGVWETQGFALGLPTLALNDTVQVDARHLDPIAYNLAIALCTEYGADVRPVVALKAEEGLQALRVIYLDPPELQLEPEYFTHTESWYRW